MPRLCSTPPGPKQGRFRTQELLHLRRIDSDFEGHPTPRLPFVEVATGSLGQGICAAAGMAWDVKNLRHWPNRVYVLLGDGESAEGSVWEAAQWAAFNRLDNLCATIDINGLGQSQPTMSRCDAESLQRRWEAFGWQALLVDGHNVEELLGAYERAAATRERPTVVLARTVKGKGLGPSIENSPDWHGKPIKWDDAARIVTTLRNTLSDADPHWEPDLPARQPSSAVPAQRVAESKPKYKIGVEVAARRGFGDGLAAIAAADPRIVVLDGDVKNSTYTEEFEKAAPERFSGVLYR